MSKYILENVDFLLFFIKFFSREKIYPWEFYNCITSSSSNIHNQSTTPNNEKSKRLREVVHWLNLELYLTVCRQRICTLMAFCWKEFCKSVKKKLLFFVMLMKEKTDVGVAIASLQRGAGSCRCSHGQHWRSYSGVQVRNFSCALDIVNGIVFLMKKSVQPLLNWNVHGRRRRLRIYSIKVTAWMLLNSERLSVLLVSRVWVVCFRYSGWRWTHDSI